MDQNYVINQEVMNIQISYDEIDRILDKHLDKEDVLEEESEKIIVYILQLFYRSGRIESCTEDVHEKYNNLIASRAIQLMDELGVIEESFDVKKQEYVYTLNKKGLEIANDNL